MRALALAGAVVAALSFTSSAGAQVPAPDDDPFYAVPAGVSGLRDGAVLRSRPITATSLSVPMPADAWQVLYKTVDNTGKPSATVTTIMVPRTAWTGKGPRPVVSYQTAEDGVGTKCSPSYSIRGGLAAPTNSSGETQLMQQALLRGWTVVAPDYEGPRSMFLGAEGEARGVLDGLRAARAFAPAGIDRSAPLGLWGYSGGAFASSVAAQMQPRHAPELKLQGVALGGIVADLRETIHAFSGSFAGGALIMGFVAVDRSYPEYDLTRYINQAGRQAMANSQTDCINDAAAKYPFARLEQYIDPGLIDGPALRPMFERINPLTFPGVPDAPVYEYHSQIDQLAPIGPARKLVDRFCRAGVPVQQVESVAGEHLAYLAVGAPGAMDFLGDRFAGKPVTSPCARPAGGGRAGRQCVSASGGVGRTGVGQARLGRTRTRQRKLLRGTLLSDRPKIDRYCVGESGGALRVGYPTARLASKLSRRSRARIRSKAIVLLSTSKAFKVARSRVGTKTTALRRRLKGERRYRVGRNVWYVATGAKARILFRARRGKVLELGLADRRLTATRAGTVRLLRAWDKRG